MSAPERNKKQRNTRKVNPLNGKLEYKEGGHLTKLTIRTSFWEQIKLSPFSASKLLDMALTYYFKDHFIMRLENSLNQLYEDVLMLEKLQSQGKMGTVKFSDAHLMQLESYQDAIKILENSPLINK